MERRRWGCSLGCVVALMVLLVSGIFVLSIVENIHDKRQAQNATNATTQVAAFAEKHDLEVSAWPDKLVTMLENNPETADFVLMYPLCKGQTYTIDLQKEAAGEAVPLLMQWDTRWGYEEYAGECMGLSGCGPVCLSMVCLYVLDDPTYDPLTVARFAEENGYAERGSGSKWTLISEGGEQLGLDITEIPLDEKRMRDNLAVGNPIICVMGMGDFTSTGHFIVLTDYEDGKVRVNDPNSIARSERWWEFDAIKDQIRNWWVCRASV